jgi:hypothetical protein
MRRCMMFSVIVMCLAVSGLFGPPVAGAAGLGLYGAAGGGDATWTSDYSDGSSSKLDKDVRFKVFGIILDTAPSEMSVFDYRLNIGAESLKAMPGRGTNTYNLHGVVLDNDFGFGIIRTRGLRVWLGPEIRFAYRTGDDGADGVTYRHVKQYGAGLGPVLGIDVHLGAGVFLALKGGFLANYYVGTGDRVQAAGVDADFHEREMISYAQVGILFRFGQTAGRM